MEPCVFCDIVAGRAEASFVYQGNLVVAFLTIQPVTPGHLMVVPREHHPHLKDIDEPLGSEMFSVARLMGEALRESDLECEGVNLFYADGEAAFQEIFHSHLHVFPRFPNDGFRLDADWTHSPTRTELDRNAELIRNAASSFD